MTKIKGKLNELQQPVARTENKIHRGKTRRRVTKKQKNKTKQKKLEKLPKSAEEERTSYQHQRQITGNVRTHKSRFKQGKNKGCENKKQQLVL